MSSYYVVYVVARCLLFVYHFINDCELWCIKHFQIFNEGGEDLYAKQIDCHSFVILATMSLKLLFYNLNTLCFFKLLRSFSYNLYWKIHFWFKLVSKGAIYIYIKQLENYIDEKDWFHLIKHIRRTYQANFCMGR